MSTLPLKLVSPNNVFIVLGSVFSINSEGSALLVVLSTGLEKLSVAAIVGSPFSQFDMLSVGNKSLVCVVVSIVSA